MQDDIINMAGRPGDRWASLRKKAGREESPDTVVFAFFDLGRKFWHEVPGLKSSAEDASD